MSTAPVFEFTRPQLVWGAATILLLAFVFQGTFGFLYANWQREEYSHGFLIPLASLFLLWQRRRQLEQMPFTGTWAGVALIALGLAIFFLGMLAAINTIDAYGFVVVIAGCLLATMGWPAFRLALAPLALLVLMNPLPSFLYNNLSSKLQLLSSELGVAVIRFFDISVFLQGNVIDLGTYKLQVVEACSGLNYLFPLLTLGFMMACFLKVGAWIRVLIVLSTVPITILMNSFRIGVIGLLVDRYGIAQAEGFLHFFEGWIIFMACMGLLLAETWVLVRLSGDRRAFRDVFVVEFPGPRPPGLPVQPRRLGAVPVVALALILLAVLPTIVIPQRAEIPPSRTQFIEFPMRIGEWQGRRDRIEPMYLDILQLDDYVIADYAGPGGPGINFYSAFYASQRGSASAHSPSSCLPGDGWRIAEMATHGVKDVRVGNLPLRVNRVVIQKGSSRQLVYYWFQQRGRVITNEYMVKWYIFLDSLTRNRSDGALVRIITPLTESEEVSAADDRLARFAGSAVAQLGKYVPD